jgi:hypothetical protein
MIKGELPLIPAARGDVEMRAREGDTVNAGVDIETPGMVATRREQTVNQSTEHVNHG